MTDLQELDVAALARVTGGDGYGAPILTSGPMLIPHSNGAMTVIEPGNIVTHLPTWHPAYGGPR